MLTKFYSEVVPRVADLWQVITGHQLSDAALGHLGNLIKKYDKS